MITKRLQHFVHTLIVALVGSLSVDAHDFEVDGIYYNILSEEDLTCEVTFKGTSYNSAAYSGEIVIPSTVSFDNRSYSVITIGNSAFLECKNLVLVTIPNTVTSIGNGAFEGCSSLTSIYIPSSVKLFIGYIFYNCEKLQEINVSDDNEVYSSVNGVLLNKEGTLLYRFPQGSLIKDYVIPNTVNRIGNDAFYNCHIESVTIPKSVNWIGMCSFYGCENLSSVEIPNSVTYIDYGAFGRCTNLSYIEIPNSIHFIFQDAFDYCSNLNTVKVNKLSPYDMSASCYFTGTPTTKTLLVPAGCKDIYKKHEYWKVFSNVVEFDIPMKDVEISGIYYNSYGNNECEVTYKGENSLSYDEYEGNIVIPSSIDYNGETYTVTSIRKNAFNSCHDLISVELPNSIKTIGESAFCYCRDLKSINIPESVVDIYCYTFSYCSSLESIDIPKSQPVIWGDTFNGCSSLKSLTIPKSVTEVSNMAFYGLDNLQEISILNTTPPEIYSHFAVDTVECVLKVPVSAVDTYKATKYWNEFKNIVAIEEEPETTCSMYLESQEVKKGGVVKIPVYMTNDVEITSFNCDITLPEGLSIEQDEYGDYAFELADRSDATFNILSADVDGKVRVVVYSGKNHTFTGNEGAVFYIPVVADDGIENGTVLTMTLSRTTITDLSTMDDIDVDDSSAQFTIKPAFTIGDVNGDERFTAADVSLTTEYVLGRSPEQGVPQAADTNGDGRYTAADISAVVLKVLEGTGE